MIGLYPVLLVLAMFAGCGIATFSVGVGQVSYWFPRKEQGGALGGLLWFAISSILEALLVIFLHKGPELRNELIKRIQQAASQTTDPQALEMFDRLKTPGGLEFLMIAGVVLAFVAAIVLAGLGGALGGAIFGRRGRT